MVLDFLRIVFAPARRGLPTAQRSHRETNRKEIRNIPPTKLDPLDKLDIS